MNSFTYDYPVRNYFGEGAMDQALDAEMGAMGKTVMLAYGGGSVKRTGVYGHVVDKLTSAGKRVVDFGGMGDQVLDERLAQLETAQRHAAADASRLDQSGSQSRGVCPVPAEYRSSARRLADRRDRRKARRDRGTPTQARRTDTCVLKLHREEYFEISLSMSVCSAWRMRRNPIQTDLIATP